MITRQNWWAWLSGVLLLTLMSTGLLRAICVKGIESSEAAGWMQAIGSIAAIVGAFRIVQKQHKVERELDIERRAVDVKTARGDALTRRILALRNTIQVATQAIDAMRNAVENVRNPEGTYSIEQYIERLAPIANILDSFVTPHSNHIAVLAALNISLAITAVLEDLKRVGGSMTTTLLARCDAKILECEMTLKNLIKLNEELMLEHNERGVDSIPV